MAKNRQVARWTIMVLIAMTGICVMAYVHMSYRETISQRNDLELLDKSLDAREQVLRTVQSRLELIVAIEAYLGATDYTPGTHDFNRFLDHLMVGAPELQSVYVANADWVVTYSHDILGGSGMLGKNLRDLPTAAHTERAISSGKITVGNYTETADGTSAFVASRAMTVDGRLLQIVNVVISVDQIRQTLFQNYSQDFIYTLCDASSEADADVIAGVRRTVHTQSRTVTMEDIVLGDHTWLLIMDWRRPWLRPNPLVLWVIYGVGTALLTAILLVVNGLYARTHWLQRTVTSRTQDLAQTNQELYASNSALKESEERFRNTFEHAYVGMGIVDRDGDFVRHNQRFLQTVGYTVEQLREMSFGDLWHPDDREEAQSLLDRVYGQLPYQARVDLRCHHGVHGLAWVRLTMSSVPDRGGDSLAMLVVDDITEAREQAQELAEARALMQNVYTSLGEAVLVLDPLGERILACNPAIESIFGYATDELIDYSTEQLHLNMEAYLEFRATISRIHEGDPYRGTTQLQHKDGEILRVEVVATALPASDASEAGIVLVLRDVTERERAEAALRASNTELEAAMRELQLTQDHAAQQERLRALGQLASGIAHDFNNALAVVSGFTERMLTKPATLADPVKSKRYLELIATAASDAAKIVNRMREFYRPRSAGEQHEAIDLPRLLEDVVHLTEPKWRTQAQARGRQIRVSTEIAPQFPTFYGNPAEVRELLTNLVMNAVDAMPRGGMIQLRAKYTDGAVALQVHDTGTGMSEEVRQRCLEPFYTTKANEEGSGLGLAMVYGIVNRHQGQLTIDSTENVGTCFTITMPINTPAYLATAAPTLEMVPGDRVLDILVVEDDVSVRELLRDHLSDDGHHVVSHADGRSALEEFRDQHFDLVITDRAMPIMSGDDLATAVKLLAPRVPVIMISGFGDMMLGVDERPNGVDMVLGKPVDPGMLRKTIAELTLHVN